MTIPMNLDHCRAFIDCQLQPGSPGTVRPAQGGRLAITISRLTGAGAWLVAEKLAPWLDQHAPAEGCRWTVFDKDLVEKVLEDHKLPAKLAQFMPEDRVSQIQDMMQEVLGLHPSSWTLGHQATETILKLAELGNVILIGRGANVVTARLPHVFHARLVGSLEKRTARIRELLQLDQKAALEFIEKADRGRDRYVRQQFRADINDPMLYDLIINTDRIDCDEAAALIGQAALHRRQVATTTPAQSAGR